MDDRSAQAIRYISEDCPPEVMPLILAFCGPQQTLALSLVSKQFHAQINTERTFRVLSEELYKVGSIGECVGAFAVWIFPFEDSFLALFGLSLER